MAYPHLAGFSCGSSSPGTRNGKRPRKNEEKDNLVATGEMVKDPFCGAFVSKDGDIRVRQGDKVHYFCSYECRDKYVKMIRATPPRPFRRPMTSERARDAASAKRGRRAPQSSGRRPPAAGGRRPFTAVSSMNHAHSRPVVCRPGRKAGRFSLLNIKIVLLWWIDVIHVLIFVPEESRPGCGPTVKPRDGA
jgi:ribosomal protein L24E